MLTLLFLCQIKTLEADIEDITVEFQNERTDYLETIRRLDQQSKLLQAILEKVTNNRRYIMIYIFCFNVVSLTFVAVQRRSRRLHQRRLFFSQ